MLLVLFVILPIVLIIGGAIWALLAMILVRELMKLIGKVALAFMEEMTPKDDMDDVQEEDVLLRPVAVAMNPPRMVYPNVHTRRNTHD